MLWLVCLNERPSLGGGRETSNRSVGAIDPLRVSLITIAFSFYFFFRSTVPTARFYSHCSKGDDKGPVFLCVNRREGPKCETAWLRQQNRKCLNILYRQSHVAARAGGGWRLAGATLPSRACSKTMCSDRLGKAQMGHFVNSRYFGNGVCLLHFRCWCVSSAANTVMTPACPVAPRNFIFVYDIADFREQVRECSSGHNPRIRRCKQPGRSWQPAQGRNHNVCPSALGSTSPGYTLVCMTRYERYQIASRSWDYSSILSPRLLHTKPLNTFRSPNEVSSTLPLVEQSMSN